MKIVPTYEQFINEIKKRKTRKRKRSPKNKKTYLEMTSEYEKLVKKLGIRKEEGIYDCHGWVGKLMKSNEKENIEYFLFDESKESNYYKNTDSLDKEFKKEFEKLGDGVWPYFDYVLGHSFIRDNGIFIDLTLHSEGMEFNDIQKICSRLSEFDMFHS
jgi:hypothetical protein